MPIDPNTGQPLPYPGDPGAQQQAGGMHQMPDGSMMPDQAMQGGGAPPETLDGPQGPQMPVGISLNPAQMAAIALQAVAQIAGIDLQQFQQEQQTALEQVPQAIQAIMQQLQMQAQAPETLDGPQAPMGPATTMPMSPQDQPGAMLA